MVDLARQRLGEDADLQVADLAAPLPFADAEFDDVVASLVLHYLEDWAGAARRAAPRAEARRSPDGLGEPPRAPTRSCIPTPTTSR